MQDLYKVRDGKLSETRLILKWGCFLKGWKRTAEQRPMKTFLRSDRANDESSLSQYYNTRQGDQARKTKSRDTCNIPFLYRYRTTTIIRRSGEQKKGAVITSVFLGQRMGHQSLISGQYSPYFPSVKRGKLHQLVDRRHLAYPCKSGCE